MNAGPAYRLVVLRHGQSEWNAGGRFTGWVNAELTRDGEREAARDGIEAIRNQGRLAPAALSTTQGGSDGQRTRN